MSFRSAPIHQLYAIRWDYRIVTVEIMAVMKEVAALAKEAGQPLQGLIVLPENFVPPDSEARQFMGENLRKIIGLFDHVAYVIEGSGFKSSIIRSVVTNILMITGHRAKISVHGTIRQGIAALLPHLGQARLTEDGLYVALKGRGLCEPITPVDRKRRGDLQPAP